jgi:hypothetical protein
MNALQKAPTILTRAGAEKITARIAQKLDSADADLARAYVGRVWEALDLPDWDAWVATRLPQLDHLKLSIPVRLERVKELRLVGASERAIAAACGVSPASTHADLERLRADGQLPDEPGTVTSLDGRRRPSQQPATAAEAREAAQIERHGLTLLLMECYQRIEQAGDAGLTALELERKTRWRHGRVSSLLHRLEKHGAAVRDREQTRDGYVAYVAQPLSD